MICWLEFGSDFLSRPWLMVTDGWPRFKHECQETSKGVRKTMQSMSWGVALTFLAILAPIVLIFPAILLLVSFFVLVLYILLILAILSTALIVVAAQQLFIWIAFIAWVVFYRYPLFDLVHARLQARIRTNNSAAYWPLPSGPSIRVVRLKPGEQGSRIECSLITGSLEDMEFEALSYVWGVSLHSYRIDLDRKPFFVTYNLHVALAALRHRDHDVFFWIDAICINQNDNAEKSSQVQMMRDIYAKATRTHVWLGLATDDTSRTFESWRRFSQTTPEERKQTALAFESWTYGSDNISEERDPCWGKPDVSDLFQDLLVHGASEIIEMTEHEWWRRVWVIQEVVLSREVVLRRGDEKLDWDTFYILPAIARYPGTSGEDYAMDFAKMVQRLRVQIRKTDSGELPSLLDLVHSFRFQASSLGADKIYALTGLLPANHPSLLAPDYGEPTMETYMRFTLSSIIYHEDLNILAFAAGAEMQGMSWCRDWALQNDGMYELEPFSKQSPSGRKYSASGTLRPRCSLNRAERLLSLQGFKVDTVVRCGNIGKSSRTAGTIELERWEDVAGVRNRKRRESFNRTITADCWTKRPVDWRQYLTSSGAKLPSEGAEAYEKVINNACSSRRFFVTRSGRFGLGPWGVKQGDAVCVLFGGKTPFILRQKAVSHKKQRRPDSTGSGRQTIYYKLIGETFVDGLMYSRASVGDMGSDLNAPEWFHIV
jgi:hypothetical protein